MKKQKTQAPAPYRPVPRVAALDRFGTRVDVVGDVHGCVDEVQQLFGALGHSLHFPDDPNTPAEVSMAPGRALVFIGDLTDRGPRSRDALRLLEGALNSGAGFAVTGNHDSKLMRALAGQPITIANGLQGTLDELETVTPETRMRWRDMLHKLPHQIRIPAPPPVSADGYATLVHGAAPSHHQDQANANSLSRGIYGYADGATDSQGNLIRDDWARVYSGPRMVIHGHTPVGRTPARNRVVCIDTGAVFGGWLTALRVDENACVRVASSFMFKERQGVTRTDGTPAGTIVREALSSETIDARAPATHANEER